MGESVAITRSDGMLIDVFRRHHDVIAEGLQQLELSPSDAQVLSRRGTPVSVPAGAALCIEGERGRQAFLILEGEAKVHTPDTVVTVGPGDVVGEIATLDARLTRNATVVAGGDLEALVYDVRTFRALASDPALRPRLVPERPAA